MKDIVERLEKDKWHITTVDVEDAIAEITRLRAEAEAEALRNALESIASMTYDSWSNGAIAGEIARYALDATKGTT